MYLKRKKKNKRCSRYLKIHRTVCCSFIEIFQIFKKFLENKCKLRRCIQSCHSFVSRVGFYIWLHFSIADWTHKIIDCFLKVTLKKRSSTRCVTRPQVDTGGSDLVRKYLETLTTFIYFPPSLLVWRTGFNVSWLVFWDLWSTFSWLGSRIFHF